MLLFFVKPTLLPMSRTRMALDCTRCALHDHGMATVSSRCWIFQALPERYNLAEQLRPGRTENWVVSRFAREITPGDVVYLWQAGSEAAVFGWATVNSPVFEPNLSEGKSSSEASPRSQRVEILYQARFEPPITRAEIRSHGQLAGLARTHGFKNPPEPPDEPQPASPVVSWDGLSLAAQDCLAWAAASESSYPRVGTRGLLIGLLRTSHPTEADQLLEYVRVRPEDVFDALRQVRPEVQINPTVRTATPLSTLPMLTPNGEQVLSAAFQLQADPSSQVELRHLFGAILQVKRSRASQVLEMVLEKLVPVEKIREPTPTIF